MRFFAFVVKESLRNYLANQGFVILRINGVKVCGEYGIRISSRLNDQCFPGSNIKLLCEQKEVAFEEKAIYLRQR